MSKRQIRVQRLSRREFLQRTAMVGAGLAAGVRAGESGGAELPTRVLGRTGAKVTILGLGTAPIGEARGDMAEAVRIFSEVIDRGVNFVDTARIYGIAEEALGQVLATRRDKVFLVTKCWTDSAARAQQMFEESLRTLKTDHVDLVHIHNVGNKNLDKVLAKDGILEYLLRQKEAGKTRFIGLSGHERPPVFLKMLETDQIDVVMSVMNYADRNIYDFEGKVLPECRKRNVGVVAMKVYAGIKGGFPNHRNGGVGCNTPPEMLGKALAYALSRRRQRGQRGTVHDGAGDSERRAGQAVQTVDPDRTPGTAGLRQTTRCDSWPSIRSCRIMAIALNLNWIWRDDDGS